MSDPDRGAYTPNTEEPLSFDARQPVRGARPFPLTLTLSAVVLLTLVVAVVLIYRGGARSAGDAPQVVGTPTGEMRGPAPLEAQPADPAAGLQIYRSEGQAQTNPVEPAFAPPPEQPQPRPAPQTAPVESAELPVAAPPKPPAAQVAQVAPRAATPPVAKPAPTSAVAAPPAAKPAASASGSYVVQIGAFSSTAIAEKEWSAAAKVSPAAAAGKSKRVEEVERDGKTLYRTSVTGFTDKADAQAFCQSLKDAGKACFVR